MGFFIKLFFFFMIYILVGAGIMFFLASVDKINLDNVIEFVKSGLLWPKTLYLQYFGGN